jgi:arabinofuranan 3-O-arabinosyltransferase
VTDLVLRPDTARPPLRIEWPSRPDRPGEQVRLRDRWCFPAVFLIALLVFAGTDTGRMIFDTKLGVDIDAAGFLARLWQLWNPLEWFGTLQNQYIGYAIPMAPFFLLGQLAHVPVWLIERLWLALLITVGFAGLVKLARALNVGTDGTRLLAGAVFALWPTFTIVIGSTSAGALPGLMAPWATLPLVGAVRGRPAGRAVALSGLAVTAMGGVNAASTGYVLVLPALFILIMTGGRLRLSLLAKWAAAVLAGTAWWLIPLLLQGRYSFNFLPYIEQSGTTFQTMSAAAFLRGTSTWTAYVNLGTPWLSAGWSEVTSPAAIMASATAAGAGLYGLARRDMPARRWLLACVGLAAAVALIGYWGPLGGPVSGSADTLFNGALAPLRSLYKIEPVVAVALALGCAHAVSRWIRGDLPLRAGRVPMSVAIAPLAALVLAGLAVPQLSGQVLQPGSFSQVPGYWDQTAAFLAANSPRQTALVVPADAHGLYLWGDPIDDPLEPLASSPWAERVIVPYGGAGSQVFLDTAEQAVESGQAVPGLPVYLARAGIRYVVVRNDLNPAVLGYSSPQVVNETLALSGFERVASFGPRISSSPSYLQTQPAAPEQAPSYPAVEIFQAVNPAWRPAGPVSALPVSGTVLVNGGPDSLLALAGQGVVTTQPAVIAGDPLPVRPDLWAVTDGQPRADNAFSLTNQNMSFTYTATEANPPDDQQGGAGGPPRQLLPVPAAGHQTVAVLSGAAQVTASSYGSWLTQEPQYDPVNAFDDNPATAWAEGTPYTPVGQWIQVSLDHALDLPATIGIQLLADSPNREIASQVLVSTAAGSVTTNLVGNGARQALSVRPGQTSWLRITITGASDVVPGAPGAGFTSVLIPGVKVTRYLQPAEDPAGAAAASTVYSFHQQVSSPAVAPGAQASEVLARTFQATAAQRVSLTAIAVATPGAALNRLISGRAGFRLACGAGPTISIDGKSYRTSVSGTLADLIKFLPVQVRLCAPGGQLALSAGRNRLLATPSSVFVMTDLDLQTQPTEAAAGTPPAAATSGGQRPVQVLTWQADNRGLRIGPGAESYVEIHENFNAGWAATLNGRPLTAVRLDGWQQAFIVPSGQGGVIRLGYAPAATYHAGLIVSALALAVLAALAIGLALPGLPGRWVQWGWQGRREVQAAGPRQESVPRHGSQSSGNSPRAGEWGRPAARTVAVFVPLAVVIWLAGGPAAIAVPVLAGLAWWRPRWLPPIAFAAMMIAGVAAAGTSNPTAMGSGAFGGLAQACALVALAAALMPVAARPAAEPAGPGERAT